MKKKRPPYHQGTAIRGALRRAFARSPVVTEVKMAGRREIPKYNKDGSRAKKNAVQYSCQVCNQWVASTKVVVDHINPVVSVEDGFQDWNTFVDRLWCDISNLQRICEFCHQIKTNTERFERMYKNESEELSALLMKGESLKPFLKKFTRGRLAKYPYPQPFLDQITSLRLQNKMKV